MMYILTKEELDNLVPKEKYNKLFDEIDKLNELVLKYSKFKCIHNRLNDEWGEWYCDKCPLADTGTCFKIKEFSQ